MIDDGSARLEAELRRGTLVLAVLAALRERQYGYSLRQALSAAGLPVEDGTLYPLLRRLESQGLLDSAWQIEDAPPRRYYRLNPAGERALEALRDSWRRQTKVIESLLE